MYSGVSVFRAVGGERTGLQGLGGKDEAQGRQCWLVRARAGRLEL
jgi:hypothetical protein